MALLRARELTKTFGPVRALDAVSFEIDEGITGLLGSNGAGKSTTTPALPRSPRPGRRHGGILGRPARHPVPDARRLPAPEHDCLPRAVSAAEFPRLHGPDQRPPTNTRPAAGVGRAPPRRPIRGALPVDGDLLDQDEAAREACTGARPRPGRRVPRRADRRPRPARPARDARSHPAGRRRVRDQHRHLDAPDGRRRARMRLRRRARRWPTPPDGAGVGLHRGDGDARGGARSRESRRSPKGCGGAASSRGSTKPPDSGGRGGRSYDTLRDVIVESNAPLPARSGAPFARRRLRARGSGSGRAGEAP